MLDAFPLSVEKISFNRKCVLLLQGEWQRVNEEAVIL